MRVPCITPANIAVGLYDALYMIVFLFVVIMYMYVFRKRRRESFAYRPAVVLEQFIVAIYFLVYLYYIGVLE